MSVASPVIVLGMHRSGTSMIVRLLEDLGLFVGRHKEENSEAAFFLSLNEWLLGQSGGAWDHPESVNHLLANDRLRALAADYVHNMLSGPRVVSYMGLNRYRRYRVLENLDFSWGWKDPRNTYTLPLWLDLFPEARVVNVYRHGVDVANSLKVREEAMVEFAATRYKRRRRLHRLLPKRSGFATSVRCLTLEGAFSLWEEYSLKASERVSGLGERALTLKYEDFLNEPVCHLRALVEFCGLSAPEARVRATAGRVRRDRAYAYLEDPELAAFAKARGGRLEALGYEG